MIIKKNIKKNKGNFYRTLYIMCAVVIKISKARLLINPCISLNNQIRFSRILTLFLWSDKKYIRFICDTKKADAIHEKYNQLHKIQIRNYF